MSGHRWSSIFCLSLLIVLSGCQSDGSNRSAWNPFSKKADAVAAEESKSSFSLPKFARRSDDKSDDNETTARSPMAVEQVDRLLERGQIALQESRLEDAKQAYTEVVQSSPDNVTAHHGLAMVADLSEQWADAEYHYRQALRLRPQDANLLCDIGYSYLLQNRYAEASRYLNHAIEINPSHESAQMNLAMLDLRQGNRAGAAERISQRYGSSAKASQILAQLEAQSGVVAEKVSPEPAAVIPANATFEQIQEIARRERVEAERRRSMSGVPADHSNLAVNSANSSVLSNENGLGNTSSSRSLSPLPTANPPAAMPAPLTAGSTPPVAAPMPVGGMAQGPPPWPNVANSSVAQPSGPTSPSSVNAGPIAAAIGGPTPGPQPAVNTNSFATSPTAAQGSPTGVDPALGNPAIGNSNGAMLSNNTSAAPAQYPITGGVGMSSVGANFASAAQGGTGNTPAPGTGTGRGRVTSIYPSGMFQSPEPAITSYGQPVGFSSPSGQPYVNAASVTNAMPANQPQPFQSVSNTNNSNASPSPQMNLEGLNVGPGALFPIGQPALQSGQAQPTPPANGGLNLAGIGDGSLKMGNISSPGANSMINGTMYPAAQSHLPSQEWMIQQQQQAALQAQQNGTALNNARVVAPGANAWPPMRAPQVNPLEAYERQRQQVDNEFNKALQQMDRQSPQGVSAAQY